MPVNTVLLFKKHVVPVNDFDMNLVLYNVQFELKMAFLLMSVELIIVFKPCIADRAMIQHNVSMNYCMTLQKVLLTECFVTHFTFKFDLLMHRSMPFKILRMLVTHITSTIKTLEELLRDMFTFMFFKFASEHKLFIAVVTFINFWFLAILMKSPCTWSIDHFLTFMTLVDNVAMVDLMVGVKVLHSVKCVVG